MGNFHQKQEIGKVHSFKTPTEDGFVGDFVDLRGNQIRLIIKDAPRCTDKIGFCKNGGTCEKGVCKCKDGFSGVQCDEGEVG